MPIKRVISFCVVWPNKKIVSFMRLDIHAIESALLNRGGFSISMPLSIYSFFDKTVSYQFKEMVDKFKKCQKCLYWS